MAVLVHQAALVVAAEKVQLAEMVERELPEMAEMELRHRFLDRASPMQAAAVLVELIVEIVV